MYGQTWADLETTPPAVAWRLIRSLRHAPPGRAQSGDRRKTFDAALEQAEQLFTAAADSGTATRPILIFYGLSQAGRAVAATTKSSEWRLRGHGITVKGPSDGRRSVSEVALQNSGRGSFTVLCAALGCASLPDVTPLGELWCLLPESRRFPLPGMGDARPLHVNVDRAGVLPEGVVRARVNPLPDDIPHRAPEGQDPSRGQAAGRHAERARLSKFLANYPSLEGWRFATPEGNPVGIVADSALLEWDGSVREETLTTGYRAGGYAFPRIGGSDAAGDPIMIWWAVLFALSMLARYEPMEWAAGTLVSQSPDAVAIEHVLTEALVVIPELIHRTIVRVAGLDGSFEPDAAAS